MARYVNHYFMGWLALAQYIVFGFLLRRKQCTIPPLDHPQAIL